MVSTARIVGVSDVSLGFGSPEVLALMDSLASYYGEEALLIEPDEITRKPLKVPPSPRLTIQRVPSTWDTYTQAYRVEYVLDAARRVNRLRPEVLVICCTFCMPVLFKLRYRPKFVIYHNYELATGYGSWDAAMNRHAKHLIDLITFPEENRARIDTAACGYDGIDKVIVYNCGDLMTGTRPDIAPAHERNGRMIYYGTIARHVALSEYFLDERIQGIPVDLYGRIMEPNEQAAREVQAGLRGSLRYHGLLDAEDLVRLRREYAFSIAMWNPTISDNHFYSAPNRLFSSIQAGVPPIVAPHPQCKMIVRRYDCGIVMRDWTFEAFRDALKEGLRLFGTARYAEMVENCRRAAKTELNWDSQFEKIKRYLPKRLSA